MRTSMVILLGTLALAGCGPSERDAPKAEDPANIMNAMTGRSDAADMAAMPDGTLRLTLARMIGQADLPCDGVVKAERLPDQDGLPQWRATCKSGTPYAIIVRPDGNAAVLARPTRQ